MNPDHPKYDAELEEAKALVIRDIATQNFAEKERQKLIAATIAAQNRAWGQPDPTPNDSEDIQSMVIRDIESRRQHGIKTYGTALQAFNGRDAVKDAYEESMDLTMYLKQMLVEDEGHPYEILWDEIGEWSNRVFGDETARGPIGPLNHLAREAKEAITEFEAHNLGFAEIELSDCLILVFDAARRAGMTPMSLVGTALEKMEVNRGRVMGEPDEEGVIEHRRDLD
jgi:hypothetical protein